MKCMKKCQKPPEFWIFVRLLPHCIGIVLIKFGICNGMVWYDIECAQGMVWYDYGIECAHVSPFMPLPSTYPAF